MILDRADAGRNIPDEFNVIIEVPAHADPVRYEADKETGALFADRFTNTAIRYPCDFGYIPHTLRGRLFPSTVSSSRFDRRDCLNASIAYPLGKRDTSAFHFPRESAPASAEHSNQTPGYHKPNP